MIRKIVSFVFLFVFSASAYGQESWTLKQCIDYAIEHNLSVQQNQVKSETQEVRLNTARNSRLPGVSASIGATTNFGRSPSVSGIYDNKSQLSSQIGANANMILFQGLQIKNDIAARTFDLQASLKDLDRAREDIALNVALLYLQAVLNRELVKVAEGQVELSRQQVQRSELLVANGKNPASELFESRAVLANDELNLTQSKNTLQLSLVDLSQALNLESNAGFDIKTPDIGPLTLASMSQLDTPERVYDYAVENRPQVLAENFRLQSSQKSLSSARAARYPTISLQAGYGNNFFYSLKTGDVNKLFSNQFRDNGNEYIGLSINIPIFNKLATRNNIRVAQNNIRLQTLAVTDAQRSLRKEIEQSYYNADAAYQKYLSAEKALEAAREAFRYQKEKADAGRSTIFDYNDAKTRMEKAESQMVQAKFDFVFRRQILDFYAGHPLDFSAY